MTTGINTTGLTNCPGDGQLAIQPLLCAPGAVEQLHNNAADVAPSDTSVHPNADSWRVEVAARLERYRTRRKPRTPRYPSLLLPFDSPESWSRPAPLSGSPIIGSPTIGSPTIGSAETGSTAVATAPLGADPISTFEAQEERTALAEPPPFTEPRQAPEQSAKVLEFPRSAAIPVFQPSDLADPV